MSKQKGNNRYWVSKGKLMAGEYPFRGGNAMNELNALLKEGVTSFIDLTERNEGLPAYTSLTGKIKHQRFPIVDVAIPESPDYTKAILDAIDEEIAGGKVVYVHCRGGSGRTGLIVGCWLVRHGKSGADALGHLQGLWKQCPASEVWRSPNTKQQERYILDWEIHEVTRYSRYQGCLLGLAAGDAVGTTVEFMRPGTFPPVTDMKGGGPFRLKAGQWTDDTSMALCLADSLISCDGFVPKDQMIRFLKWYRNGYLSSTGKCFDIGQTTSTALFQFEKTGNPYSGTPDKRSAGNGSLMRLAAVPMFYANNPEKAVEMCGLSSATTHGAIAAIDACRFYGGLIVGALNGVSKEELLSPGAPFEPVKGLWERKPLCEEVMEVASGSYQHKQPPQIKGSGYVVESMEAALWAFYTTDNFKDGCLLAVNLGDDADTTAAIYGQLAGAFYGVGCIPANWRKKLSKLVLIERLAQSLLELSSGSK